MSVSNARKCGEHLQDQGLIETVGKLGASDLCRLTLAGMAHWQRNPGARRAEPPASPLRSERIFRVLSHLEGHGPTRTSRYCERSRNATTVNECADAIPEAQGHRLSKIDTSHSSLRTDDRWASDTRSDEGI